jgi:hypothetical protein
MRHARTGSRVIACGGPSPGGEAPRTQSAARMKHRASAYIEVRLPLRAPVFRSLGEDGMRGTSLNDNAYESSIRMERLIAGYRESASFSFERSELKKLPSCAKAEDPFWRPSHRWND